MTSAGRLGYHGVPKIRGSLRGIPYMKLKIFVNLWLLTLGVCLIPLGHAQTFSVIHTFTGSGGDGAAPTAGVTIRAGTLYGTSAQGGIGGPYGPGTVYQMTHSGSTWVYTPLFLFPTDGSGGVDPGARVVFGPDGHLYGTTTVGGTYKGGVAFNLTPPLSICKTVFCSWKENVLWNFGNGADGANPGYGDLIWDDGGNIYDTTVNGGDYNYGTLYELTRNGNAWSEQVNIAFNGNNYEYCPAAYPYSGVTYVSASFFGTGSSGPFGGILWQSGFSQLSCLVGFSDNSIAGASPYAGVIADAAVNLYGASSDAGANGGGVVYEFTPSNNTFNVLYSFAGTPNQQCGPWANLTLDAAGNLYGTTRCDGANHLGNVFKLINEGNTWVYNSLYDFTGGNDGAYPISNVSIDTDGTLYGTTSSRGVNNHGTVWMIKP